MASSSSLSSSNDSPNVSIGNKHTKINTRLRQLGIEIKLLLEKKQEYDWDYIVQEVDKTIQETQVFVRKLLAEERETLYLPQVMDSPKCDLVTLRKLRKHLVTQEMRYAKNPEVDTTDLLQTIRCDIRKVEAQIVRQRNKTRIPLSTLKDNNENRPEKSNEANEMTLSKQKKNMVRRKIAFATNEEGNHQGTNEGNASAIIKAYSKCLEQDPNTLMVTQQFQQMTL